MTLDDDFSTGASAVGRALNRLCRDEGLNFTYIAYVAATTNERRKESGAFIFIKNLFKKQRRKNRIKEPGCHEGPLCAPDR